MTEALAEATVTAPPVNEAGVRIGRVTDDSPLTVEVQGTPVGEPGFLSDWRPIIGDYVALLRQDETWLALGAIHANAVSLLGRGGTVIGANIGIGGGVPANSTGAEVAFPSANWAIESTYVWLPGQFYRVDYQMSPNCSGTGAQWGVYRVRLGAQTTSGTLLSQHYGQYPAGFGTNGKSEWGHFWLYNAGSVSVSSKLSLTADFDVGVGSLGIYGGDSNAPTFIVCTHVGAVGDQLTNVGIQIG
jgi:hypothetical protein